MFAETAGDEGGIELYCHVCSALRTLALVYEQPYCAAALLFQPKLMTYSHNIITTTLNNISSLTWLDFCISVMHLLCSESLVEAWKCWCSLENTSLCPNRVFPALFSLSYALNLIHHKHAGPKWAQGWWAGKGRMWQCCELQISPHTNIHKHITTSGQTHSKIDHFKATLILKYKYKYKASIVLHGWPKGTEMTCAKWMTITSWTEIH